VFLAIRGWSLLDNLPGVKCGGGAKLMIAFNNSGSHILTLLSV